MRKLGRSIKERTSNRDSELIRAYEPIIEKRNSPKRTVGIFKTEKTKSKKQLISDEEYRQMLKDLKLELGQTSPSCR